MSIVAAFDNRVMARQLRRGLGMGDAPAFQVLLDSLQRAGANDPALAALAERLPQFVEGVVQTYNSLDRDLQLRTRSLAISSDELTQVNERLRLESRSQQRVLDTLRDATRELMRTLGQYQGPSAEADSGDLLSLAQLMRELLAQRERAQAEALSTRSRLVSAIEALDVGFAMYDQAEALVICNQTFRRIYAPVSDVLQPGITLTELLCAYHRRVIAPGGGGVGETAWVCAQRELRNSSRVRETQVGERWIRDDDTRTEDGMLVSLRTDITEMKQLNLRMVQARDTAEAANRAKSDFLANMSHEIRTPMNGVIGMTALALDTQLDAEQREYLEMVRSSADGLLVIINDILDFSKMEAGMLSMEELPVRVPDLLDECLKPLGVNAFTRGLELMYRVAPEVPARVQCDPGRLRQVLTNLVSNAVKFTEKGQVSVEVIPVERTGADRLLLEFVVRDTGIGIPLDKQRDVFEAFSQADASITRRYGGTGLGLAIAQRLVALMGGRMWLHSQPGVGSEFHFTVSVGLDESAAASLPQPGWTSTLKGLSVLIVDDNATHRQWLAESFKSWGMRPTAVASGPEALALLDDPQRQFSVCLIDSDMPGMNGLELAAQLSPRAALLRQSWMMTSAHQLAGDAARCSQLGLAGYLTKPMQQSQLLDELLGTLGQRELEGAQDTSGCVATAPPDAAALHVLLVEDMPVNQLLATRVLQKMGHRVTLAENGALAVSLSAEQSFDVVLMDMQMPVMDGLRATEAIRDRERAQGVARPLPIVAMTANAMAGDRDRCLAVGMDGYLSKPIDRTQLAEEIQRVLGRHQAHSLRLAAGASPDGARDIDLAEALDRMGGDREAMVEIALMFIADCPTRVNDLGAAVAARDAAAVSIAFHNLAGTAANLSAHGICDLAGKISGHAAAGAWSRANDLLAQLPLSLQRIENQLEHWARPTS
jgi:signal transduction histidine kinase/DNA-binding response OmpR family regulator